VCSSVQLRCRVVSRGRRPRGSGAHPAPRPASPRRRCGPAAITAIRSQSASASSMACVTSTTVTPLARSRRTSAQVSRRAAGSRPVLSSSSTTTSGRPSSASTMNSRCCCPPDRCRSRHPGCSVRPHSLEQLIGVGSLPVAAGEDRDRLAHLHPLGQDGGLQLHAHPLPDLGRVGGRVQPEDADVPLSGTTQPAAHSTVVVFQRRSGRARRRPRRAGRTGTARRRGLPAVGLVQIVDLEHGSWGHGRRVRHAVPVRIMRPSTPRQPFDGRAPPLTPDSGRFTVGG
jgi:hypothetical protein